jgi:hypothetical protein
MKGSVKTEVIVTLEMSKKEATWLKGLMQNPLYEDEGDWEADIREAIFDNIKINLGTGEPE